MVKVWYKFDPNQTKAIYSKTCLKPPLKKNTKIGFQYQFLLNAGQKYCRMLQGEPSAILSTFIKLPFSIKTIILSIFKWPLKTYPRWTPCDILTPGIKKQMSRDT